MRAQHRIGAIPLTTRSSTTIMARGRIGIFDRSILLGGSPASRRGPANQRELPLWLESMLPRHRAGLFFAKLLARSGVFRVGWASTPSLNPPTSPRFGGAFSWRDGCAEP